jgi:predicted kinase
METRLVVVTGAPAAGKSTVATGLVHHLGYPLISKDDVKESLANVLGAGDRARSRELGAAAYAVMQRLASRMLDERVNVILEANFWREQSEPWLRALAQGRDAAVIVCSAAPDVRRERFRSRGAAGQRHPVHLDAEILANEWTEDESAFRVDLGTRTLDVDTTAGPQPSIDEIARWIEPLARRF